MRYRYTHTFHLLNGDKVVAYSNSKYLPHLSLGREVAFVMQNGEEEYVIPFFNVSYVETEDTGRGN